MRKILAISGGIDSMVLLHTFRHDPEALVLHVNHGTRESCAADERFVAEMAERYGLEFVCRRLELGERVSEERARYSRHDIFSQISAEYDGVVYTAHHGDDLVESIAINLLRGTGWRGLTPFGNARILHPFLDVSLLPANLQGSFRHDLSDSPISRAEIYKYAARFGVAFRQDPTNFSEQYLRNRVRFQLAGFDENKKREIWELYHETNNLREKIETDTVAILPKKGEIFVRTWFSEMDDAVAMEILRAALGRSGISATRPQILDFLAAIRTYGSGKKFNLPGGRMVRFTRSGFVI